MPGRTRTHTTSGLNTLFAELCADRLQKYSGARHRVDLKERSKVKHVHQTGPGPQQTCRITCGAMGNEPLGVAVGGIGRAIRSGCASLGFELTVGSACRASG